MEEVGSVPKSLVFGRLTAYRFACVELASLICFSRNHLGWGWGYKNKVWRHTYSPERTGSQSLGCHNGYDSLFPHCQLATSQNSVGILGQLSFFLLDRENTNNPVWSSFQVSSELHHGWLRQEMLPHQLTLSHCFGIDSTYAVRFSSFSL